MAEACTFAVAEHCGPVMTLMLEGGMTIEYCAVVELGTATLTAVPDGLNQTYTG